MEIGDILMIAVLHIVFKYIAVVLENPMVLFFIVFLASEWCFSYLQPLVLKDRYMKFEQKALASVINGIVFVISTIHLGITSPVFLLAMTPMMMIVEVVLMTKDHPYTYLYMLLKLWVNFICIYWMIASLIGLFSAAYVTGEIVFPMTLFTCAWLCLGLVKNPKYPMKELKIMIHRKRIGLLHFVFLLGCVVSLFFSTIVLRPIIVDNLMDMGGSNRIQRIFFIEMFLKTSLVFCSSYLLLFMHARELREKQNVKALSLDLEKEEDYRRSTQQEAFLSFYVNATVDQIQEGRDIFTPFMWYDINNYAEMLQKMAFLCIHPDDLVEFIALNTLSVIEEKLEQGISIGKQLLKVQPKEMVNLFNLPVEIKEMYLNTKEEWVWIKSRYVYIKDSETDDICIYVSISDVDEKVRESEQLVINATIDQLTGIYNRATLQSMIEDKLSQAAQEGIAAGTMILLDVDSFKSINDKLGHPTGDLALKTVADNLRSIFRSNDIIGRLGGDEFCVFMEGVVEEEIVKNRLREINKICQKVYSLPGKGKIHASVSIGAFICNFKVDSYDEIYQMADEALYHTKENGKNSYTIYSDLR